MFYQNWKLKTLQATEMTDRRQTSDRRQTA